MALKVIITAGGPLPRELRKDGGPAVKALLPVGGATLLEHALRAALASSELDEVAVVGDSEVATALPAEVLYVEAGLTVVDNIYRGFQRLGGERHDYLILSPDLPFIGAAELGHFARLAQSRSGAAVPLISREDFLARFPQAPNRFEKLDGRELTMGSAIYLSGALLKRNVPLMQDFYRHRKTPHRLAAMLGLPIIWGFLTGSLRLSTVEQRFSQLMDGEVRAILDSAPELAYDIDTRQNLDYAQQHLAGHKDRI